MPDIFASNLGPTYTVTCASKQVTAEVATALAFNGDVLFVVMPTGGEYEITVRADQRRTLDAACMAASNFLTPSLPIVAEDTHLEQAYEDQISGAGSD